MGRASMAELPGSNTVVGVSEGGTKLTKGKRVRLHGLKAAADMNDEEGELLYFDKKKDRWSVQLDDQLSHDRPVLVKEENLAVLEADMDAGVFLTVTAPDGSKVVMDPGRLKDEFTRIVQQYKLERFSDRIADLLTAEEKTTVTPAELAEEFDIPVQEAGIFLAWINVGLEFKSECLTTADAATIAQWIGGCAQLTLFL